MTLDLIAELEMQAQTAPRASDRIIMREVISVIRQMRQSAANAADAARAHLKASVETAAREAYAAGRKDGYEHGVSVALDDCDPDHAATVRAWRERRMQMQTENGQ